MLLVSCNLVWGGLGDWCCCTVDLMSVVNTCCGGDQATTGTQASARMQPADKVVLAEDGHLSWEACIGAGCRTQLCTPVLPCGQEPGVCVAGLRQDSDVRGVVCSLAAGYCDRFLRLQVGCGWCS